MSEFVIIQVGQCGNQIGSALWPLILKEYQCYEKNSNFNSKKQISDDVRRSLSAFFCFSPNKKEQSYNSYEGIKARALCIDMEDSVVSRFETGPLKELFDKKSFITNYPGSGNNWAEGFCEHGPKYEKTILNRLKQVVERCDSLHGFLILFSTGGGTGSGLGTFILKLLAENYPNIERFVACVYPTGTEDVITCPYNMALASWQMLENATCVFPVENRSLLLITNNFKNQINIQPFEDMNRVIVDMILHLTSGTRFPGDLNFDMNEINTNMVPFPKMHFLSGGFGTNLYIRGNHRKEQSFLASCNKNYQMVKIDPLGSKSTLLSATIIGRGQYNLSDLQSYTKKLQSKAKFAPWSKKCIKSGLCSVTPYNDMSTVFSLFNTTGMKMLFTNVFDQFNKLMKRKAHVHHYTKMQNFDYDFFRECNESLKEVVQRYIEIEQS